MEHVIDRLAQEGLLDADSGALVRNTIAAGKPLDDAARRRRGRRRRRSCASSPRTSRSPCIDLEKDAAEDIRARQGVPRQVPRPHPARPPHHAARWRRATASSVATAKVFDTTGLDELRLASGLEFQPGARALDRDRPLHQEAPRRRRRHAPGNGRRRRRRREGPRRRKTTTTSTWPTRPQDASIIRFVNQILTEAIEMRATDVHIEPFEDQLRVRYRIDGVLSGGQRPRRSPALPGGDRIAHQDLSPPQHRREAPAAGRPHQAARSPAARSTSASRSSR